jgi:hypothetical protein
MLRLRGAMTFAGVLIYCATAAGQSIQVSGTVKDAGMGIQGARIRALDSQYHTIGQLAVSGEAGKYSIQVTRAASYLQCLVLTDPQQDRVMYANNPARQPLVIRSNRLTVDFTFLEMTTNVNYWKDVTHQVDVKAQSGGNKDAGIVTMEWKNIHSSGLSPDSKAAAAHQFLIMDWSKLIVDPTFTDYSSVDERTLSRALQGDHTAYIALPASVAKDVATFKRRASQGPG